MKAMLPMLLALHSYKQLCLQAKALFIRLPANSNFVVSSNSRSCCTWVGLKSPKKDHEFTRIGGRFFHFPSAVTVVPRGGYYRSNTDCGSGSLPLNAQFIATSSSAVGETLGESNFSDHQSRVIEPVVQDYSEISGKLKAAKFGDRSYFSTADVIASKQHRVVFILGGPGSGKGTQCDKIVQHYKCIHLSAGDLLRQEREKNGKFAQAIEEAIVGGYIVPVEITLGLLAEAMNEKVGGTEYGAAIFLIDGFPRNFDNLNGWYTFMRDKACTMGLLVINCPVEELERRILSRGETSGRSDDNIASARKRFATFESQTVPVIRLLQETDFSFDRSIDYQIAGDRTEDEVWNDIKEAMDQLVLNDLFTANQRLLDAISQHDCATYLDLIEPTMLLPPLEGEKSHHDPMTEGEIQHAIQILEYDHGHNISEQKVNLFSNVQADIMGINAVVSYDRIILNDERNKVISSMRETRIWHHSKKGWLNVHFVRRPLQQNESSTNFFTMAE